MWINKLNLINFKNFVDLTVVLNKHFNIIIGANGTGKSTLLHALQIVAGAFFLGLPKVPKRHIHENEIRFSINQISKKTQYFTPTIVEAVGSINRSGTFTWRRIMIHSK